VLGDSVRRRQARKPRRAPAAATPRRVRWKFWAPALLAVLALPFAIGYAVAVFVVFPAPEVHGLGIAVPELVGLRLAQAESAVGGGGLAGVDAVALPHPARPEGVVTAQAPLPGQQLRAGAVVRLAVSAGRPRVVVPDVVGFSRERATDLLSRLGFEVGATDEQSTETKGRVIGVDPPPGSEHELPARVTIIVSTGPPELPVDTLGQGPPLLRVDTIQGGGVLQRIDTVPGRPTVPRADTLGARAEHVTAEGGYRSTSNDARRNRTVRSSGGRAGGA
jgi:hypothetical protein